MSWFRRRDDVKSQLFTADDELANRLEAVSDELFQISQQWRRQVRDERTQSMKDE